MEINDTHLEKRDKLLRKLLNEIEKNEENRKNSKE